MPNIKKIADRYNIGCVYGDQFGAEPLKDAFQRYEMCYEERPFTNASKADIYGRLRTLISDGDIELLDHDLSLRELRGLEVELLPGGSMRVGHAGYSKARDDYADAIALAVSEAQGYLEAFCMGVAGGDMECVKLFGDYSKWSEH